MVVNLGLSCQPFAGPDIGGFVGDATPELFARFMGIGGLLPFARAHSIKGSRDHEPWSFGDECEATCRRALERRYRLIPYLYTVFEEAARTGLPIARPVWFADAADARLRGVEDAFLLGGDVLVQACVDEQGSERGAEVLRGWKEFHLEDEPDASLPRLFLRPGAVLPVAAGGAMHTGEIDMTSLTLLVSPSDGLSAEGTLYHDDGHSLAYQSGAYLRLRMHWNARDGVRVATMHGGYDAPVGFAEAVVLAPQGADTRTEVQFSRG